MVRMCRRGCGNGPLKGVVSADGLAELLMLRGALMDITTSTLADHSSMSH